jgi:hypothetical protein
MAGVAGLDASTFQFSEPGDHEAIGLACERCRQNRVTLGLAGQFLREGDQFPAAERGATTNLFGHPIMIARSREVGNLNGAPGPPVGPAKAIAKAGHYVR